MSNLVSKGKLPWDDYAKSLLDEDTSYFYFVFPEDLRERLSYNENHPERGEFLNYLAVACRQTGYELSDISRTSDPIEETIDPKIEYPEVELDYLGLEDIESNTGRASFRSMLGKDILSTSVVLRKGNIAFSRLRPYLNKACLIESDMAIGSSELLVRKPKDGVVPEFLLTYLLSDLTLVQNKWTLTGSSYPRLQPSDFEKLKVIMPKVEVQEAIMSKVRPWLDGAFKRLEDAHDLVERCEDMLPGELGLALPGEKPTYSHRAGKEKRSNTYFIFPDELGERIHFLFAHPRQAIIEELSRKYKTALLGDACKEPIGMGEQPEYSENGVMVIKTTDMHNRFIDYESTLRVPEDFYRSKPNAHVKQADILVTATGYNSLGKVDVYTLDEPAMADCQIMMIRPDTSKYNLDFLLHYLRSPFGQVQFEKWFSGSSGQIHIYPQDLARFIIPSYDAIPLDKQEAIAEVITSGYTTAADAEAGAEASIKDAMGLFVKTLLGEVI